MSEACAINAGREDACTAELRDVGIQMMGSPPGWWHRHLRSGRPIHCGRRYYRYGYYDGPYYGGSNLVLRFGGHRHHHHHRGRRH